MRIVTYVITGYIFFSEPCFQKQKVKSLLNLLQLQFAMFSLSLCKEVELMEVRNLFWINICWITNRSVRVIMIHGISCCHCTIPFGLYISVLLCQADKNIGETFKTHPADKLPWVTFGKLLQSLIFSLIFFSIFILSLFFLTEY